MNLLRLDHTAYFTDKLFYSLRMKKYIEKKNSKNAFLTDVKGKVACGQTQASAMTERELCIQHMCCLLRLCPQLKIYQNNSSQVILPGFLWCSWQATPRTATDELTSMTESNYLMSLKHAICLVFVSHYHLFLQIFALISWRKKVCTAVTEIAPLLLLNKLLFFLTCWRYMENLLSIGSYFIILFSISWFICAFTSFICKTAKKKRKQLYYFVFSKN